MAIEKVIAFWDHVQADRATQAELEKSLKSADPTKKKAALAEVQKVAKSKGYDFTAEDLDEFFARAPSESGELKGAELEKVAGGAFYDFSSYLRSESYASSFLYSSFSLASRLDK